MIIVVCDFAPEVSKFLQTRVNRRYLGRVFYDLMYRYDEPGVRTSLQNFAH